jgi:tRNA-specific 2-thiouridylase
MYLFLKQSTGLCFVGKRNFQTFIAEYIPDSPGVIIDIDRGTVVGQHKGLHFYTVGQRARIGGCQNAYYVVGKDVASKQLLVGNMVDHPAMFCMEFGIQDIKWISDTAQHALKEHGVLECMMRYRHRQPLFHCKLSVCHGFTGTTTKYSVKSDKPLRAVAPGQVAVFYGEDECFGGAIITEQGKTCLQQNITLIDTSNAII